MKTLSATIVIALGFASITTSPGRIGETREQCAKRYGEPVATRDALLEKSEGDAEVFSFRDFEVVVEYRGGKVWMVSYSARSLAKKNAEKILANYAEGEGGAKWKDSEYVGVDHYNDTEGGLHAVLYGSPQNKLVVFSKAAVGATFKPRIAATLQPNEEEGTEAVEGDEPPKEVSKDPFDGF